MPVSARASREASQDPSIVFACPMAICERGGNMEKSKTITHGTEPIGCRYDDLCVLV